MPFPFLDLPPEIREKVYILVCTDPDYIFLSSPHPAHPFFPYSLLLACHQLYHEVRPLYFMHNKFAITLSRHNGPLSYFLLPSFADNLRSVKTLRLTILRWGSKDYFINTFAPVLSDLILKGSLRNLEVRVKRKYMFAYDVARDSMMLNVGSRTVAELLKICEDPYLENVKLQTYEGKASDDADFLGCKLEDITDLLSRSSVAR